MLPSGTQKRNVFTVNASRRYERTEGMSAEMLLQGKINESPNVPMLQRQSLGQQVLHHRFQQTEYFSKLRNYGLRPDYPIAHVLSLIKLSPAGKSSYPVIAIGYHTPATAQGGVMRAPPRFKKALRSPLNIFTPPTY